MSKLVKESHLNEVALSLWDKTKIKLNDYVNKYEKNVIIGKTTITNGCLLGGVLSSLNNTNATKRMERNTQYSGSPSMKALANEYVSYIEVAVDEEFVEVGDVVDGGKIGVISKANNRVIEHLYSNMSVTVKECTSNLISSSLSVLLPIDKSWDEDVYFIIGCRYMKWNRRADGMTDLTLGGENGMPSIGNTVSPNSSNYIGQVIIYSDEVNLNDLAEKVYNAPDTNVIGELKTLAYDVGDIAEISDFTWLKCDGRAVSKNDYASLYGVLSNTYGESADTFNLPNNQSQGYLYICAK